MASPHDDRFRLMETAEGTCSLQLGGQVFEDVAYRFERYQGMTSSGLPVPGVHRLDGAIVVPDGVRVTAGDALACQLSLPDGRRFSVQVVDTEGRIVAHGHGPSKCSCC